MNAWLDQLKGDPEADRVVPPSGFTARLTFVAAAAMAFLAVFALALSFAAGRLADRWEGDTAQTSTVRLPAAASEEQISAVMIILQSTQGVSFARVLDASAQQALLAPWFGPGMPLDDLPVPQLIEVTQEPHGIDAENLVLRLAAEVPSAVFDDHAAWRAPLARAARSLRLLGWVSALLIGGAMAVIVTLAAQAALSANAQVIAVLRLVGATDHYIARAFVRRFTARVFFGALIGTVLGIIVLALLPTGASTGDVLTALDIQGWGWLGVIFVPFIAAITAYVATGVAARNTLEGLA